MSNNDMPHRQLNDYYVTLISTPAPPNRLRHSEERSNCRRAIDHPSSITQASRSYHTHKSKGITKEHPTQYAIFVQVRKSIHCYLAQYQYLGKSSSCCYTCQQRNFTMISNDFKWSSTIIDYPSTCLMSTSVVSPIVDAIRSISVLIKYQHQHKQWNELTIVLFPFGISYTINIFQDRISVTNTHRRKLIFCWCWRSKRSRATSTIRYNVVFVLDILYLLKTPLAINSLLRTQLTHAKPHTGNNMGARFSK